MAHTNESTSVDDRGFDEAASELGAAGEAAKWFGPFGSIAREQNGFAIGQFGPSWIIRGQASQSDLNADEFAARVVVLIEPIGKDQPRRIIVGRGADMFEKAKLSRGHDGA
jgi:hypothetical protein